MVGVGLFDVVLGGVVLLVEQSPEVLGGEGNDVGGVLLDDCLRVVLEDVGQFFGHHDLFGTVDALFPHVGHFCNLYYYVRAVHSTHFMSNIIIGPGLARSPASHRASLSSLALRRSPLPYRLDVPQGRRVKIGALLCR